MIGSSSERAAERPRTGARRALQAALAALALVASLALSGCDNPACIFSGNCNLGGGTGTLGTNPATRPPDFALLSPGLPSIQSFFPTVPAVGPNTIDPDTPLVVVFNESMNEDSLSDAFDLTRTAGGGGPVGPVPFSGQALVGDGRVLVLFPAFSLPLDASYELSLNESAAPFDLVGTTLRRPADDVVGTFDVPATAPSNPTVVTTFPRLNAVDQSTTTEVVAFFSRRLNSFTVDASSFQVTVRNAQGAIVGPGAGQNPLAQPVSVVSLGGNVTPDTRVYRWRSADNNGQAVSLGVGNEVTLELSSTNIQNRIEDQSGFPLAVRTFTFDLAAFEAPTAARITSSPSDAINIDNLDGSGINDLEVEVSIGSAMAGDRLSVFLFGLLPNTSPPRLGTLLREVDITMAAPTLTLTAAQLDLTSSTAPVTGRFADGPLSMAFSLRRGNAFTPVRRLDVDAGTVGIQDPLFDVTPPRLLGFGALGTSPNAHVSDQGHVAVLGLATESLAAVTVDTTDFGDNAPTTPVVGVGPLGLAPVVGSTPGGSFLARPVDVGASGVIDPAMPQVIDVTLYDQALNASMPVSAAFAQVGAVVDSNPGGGVIDVEVFAAGSLAPITTAQVYLHDNNGGTLTLEDNASTAPLGVAQLSLMNVTGQPLITVDAPGFDLFTFHDVSVSRVSVPLTLSVANQLPGSRSGTLTSETSSLGLLDRAVADSRGFATSEPLIGVSICSFNGVLGLFECPYGPASVQSGVAGSTGAVVFDGSLNIFNFDPLLFLKFHDLRLPSLPVFAGQPGQEVFFVPGFLDAPGVADEERAIEGPRPTLSLPMTSGLGMTLDGAPRVLIEARVPGLGGTALTGLGLGLPTMTLNQWDVRSAFPGSVDSIGPAGSPALGRLVTSGTIEDTLLLRCEVRDTLGNVSGARPTIVSATNPNAVTTLRVPGVTAPVSNSGGTTYDVTFPDVIGGAGGIYRLTLVDANGRAWTHYRAGAQSSIPVPEMSADVGFLMDGTISASVAAFRLPGFDRTEFLWSDVERDHSDFAISAPVDFDQQP